MPMSDLHPTLILTPVLSKHAPATPPRSTVSPVNHVSPRDSSVEALRTHSRGQAPLAEEQLPSVGAQGHPVLLEPPSAARERHVQNVQLLFVVGTMVSSFLLTGLAAWLKLGPASAFVLTLLIALSLLVYSLWTRNPLVNRLLVFGLVFGLGELVADYFCVTITQTLVYPGAGPLLWVSPAYMPLAWMVLMIQFGTLADALMRRIRCLSLVTVLMAVLGGFHIPVFETLAHYAGAWTYQNTPLIFDTTPTYIILAEVLLSIPLPWMVSRMNKARGWWQPSSWGLVQAAWTLVSVVVAFRLLGS